MRTQLPNAANKDMWTGTGSSITVNQTAAGPLIFYPPGGVYFAPYQHYSFYIQAQQSRVLRFWNGDAGRGPYDARLSPLGILAADDYNALSVSTGYSYARIGEAANAPITPFSSVGFNLTPNVSSASTAFVNLASGSAPHLKTIYQVLCPPYAAHAATVNVGLCAPAKLPRSLAQSSSTCTTTGVTGTDNAADCSALRAVYAAWGNKPTLWANGIATGASYCLWDLSSITCTAGRVTSL